MKIGIDIDGTITKYPEFFVKLGKLIKQDGGKVYIITGLGNSGLSQRMHDYVWFEDKSWYDEIITTASYNIYEKNLIGHTDSNEEIVGRFKQRICKELEIDIMFDDMAAIHRQFGNVPIFEVK